MRARIDKRWIWVFGIIIGTIAITSTLSYMLNNERVRRYAESKMNGYLKGYSVRVGRANFNPLFFSLLLRDVTLVQDANPEPPVANIRALRASLHWSELLRGHIVAEFQIDNPKVFMDLSHFRTEEQSPVPLKQKGWQEAVQAIYPVKINYFRISEGEITYVDHGPYRPLHARDIDLVASNIRNIEYPDNVYPSSVHLKGTIFERGELTLDGRANFLERPHMAFKGEVVISDMDLSYFQPILLRSNLSLRSGTVSTAGTIEYTPKLTAINVDNVEINDMAADYIHLPQTAGKEKRRVHQAATKAGEHSNEPASQVRVGSLEIRNSTLGYHDKTAKPGYRVFFSGVSGRLSGFTNQLKEGPSKFDLRGKFLGSGETRVDGTIRPETEKMNVALKIAIENTDMRLMNDMFRSAVNVDVKSGSFSLYSEMRIQNDQVNGWVKPIFKNLEIGDRNDKDSGFLHKAYVGTVKALAKVLENRSKDQVATVTDISGPIEDPNADIIQVVTRLVGNAWIRAIVPGFERETKSGQKD